LIRFYSLIAILLGLITNQNVLGQSITPSTINNGGGYSNSLEWSIGESASIANFTSPTHFLNTGVLQPITIENKGNNGSSSDLGIVVTIGPNPTNDLVHLKLKFKELGYLLLQLTDAKSALVFSKEVEITNNNSYENDLRMEQYAAGVYFLRVYFKSTSGNEKKAIYKIVKI
jgi:hypothetical protein